MYNTFGVKANSLYFEDASTLPELINILKNPLYQNVDKFILGGGSNVLFTQDFNGLVIKISLKGINVEKEDENNIYVKAYAGEIWDDLVSYCVEKGYGGFENLSGIPGLVGATPIQNIGAYGSEIKETFESLEAVNINTGETRFFNLDECKFGYRDSVFKNELKNQYVVVSVFYKLSKKPIINLSYKALKDYFDLIKNNNPTILDVRNAVIKIRSEKLPDIIKFGTAGSFFKNAIISKDKFEILQKNYPDVPFFLEENEKYKIPTGWLIEKAGFKGQRYGNCGVYEKQALVLINFGGATGLEVFEFSKLIQDKVKSIFDIDIEREVVVI